MAGVLVALIVTAGLLAGCGTSKTSTPAASGNSGGGTATPAASTNIGTCPSSNTKSFAKTKFVLHAGLAFGAFHHYLYKPFKAGKFRHGAHGRVLAIVKGGAAAVFIEHEVRTMAGDVEANPTLCKVIAAPMRDLYSSVTGLAGGLKSGNTAGITSGESAVSRIKSLSSGHGAPITENANPSIGV